MGVPLFLLLSCDALLVLALAPSKPGLCDRLNGTLVRESRRLLASLIQPWLFPTHLVGQKIAYKFVEPIWRFYLLFFWFCKFERSGKNWIVGLEI